MREQSRYCTLIGVAQVIDCLMLVLLLLRLTKKVVLCVNLGFEAKFNNCILNTECSTELQHIF